MRGHHLLLTAISAVAASAGEGEPAEESRASRYARRQAEIRECERLPPEEAVPLLEAALFEEFGDLRSLAAEALGRLGGLARAAAPSLAQSAHDEDALCAVRALRAIAMLGAAGREAAPLIRGLGRNGTLAPEVRVTLRAIGAEEEPPPPAPALPLAPALASDDWRAAGFAAAAPGAADGPDGIPLLESACRVSSPFVRWYAAEALARRGRAGATALAGVVRSGPMRARRLAATALGWMEEAAAPAVPALVAFLREDDPESNLLVCAALGRVGRGATEALPALIEVLERNRSPAEVSCAAEALGRIGPGAAAALPALTARADAGPAVFEALVRIGDGRGIPALAGYVCAGRGPYVPHAAAALARFGDAGAAALVEAFPLADPDSQANILGVLARDRPDSGPLSAVIGLALRGGDPRSVRQALREVEKLSRPRDVPLDPFLDAIAGAADAETAAAIARTMGATRTLAELRPMLSHASAGTRRVAAEALAGHEEGEAAFEEVAALLEDPEGDVRLAAAETLAVLSPADSTPRIVAALLARPDGKEQWRLMGCLLRSGPAAVPCLAGRLAGEDEKAALLAASVLDRMEPKHWQVLLPAITGLAQEDSPRGDRCVGLLGRIGSAAVPALRALLLEGTGRRCAMVARALADAGDRGLEALAELLVDDRGGARPVVASALEHAGPRAEFLLPGLIANPSVPHRLAAVGILRRIRSGAGAPLILLAGDAEADVRRAAVEALAVRDERECIEAAIARLGDPDEGVRLAAEGVVLRRPPERLTPVLAASEESPLRARIDALLVQRGREALVALRAALRSGTAVGKRRAAGILRALGPGARPALPELVAALGDPEAARSAAGALEAIGPGARAAIPALEKAARDPALREAAEAALRKIRT